LHRRAFEAGTARLQDFDAARALEARPPLLEEQLTAAPAEGEHFNKMFACAWTSSHEVLAGTKDNKLLRYTLGRDFRVLRREVLQIRDGVPERPKENERGGLHALVLNKPFGGNQLACGSNDPSDVVVMDSEALVPQLLLKGNADWMFSCCWIGRDRLLSCSKDTTVRLWSTAENSYALRNTESRRSPDPALRERFPEVTRDRCQGGHTARVREIKYNQFTQRVVSLSTDANVKIWDGANLDVVSDIVLPLPARDLVALALDEMGSDAIAVGGRSEITFLDERTGGVQRRLQSVPNNGSGVRSLAFRGNLLSVGCGGGLLLLYDTRKEGSYLARLQLGAGHVRQGEQLVATHNATKHAAYAQAWDPSGAALLVCGGPLQVGVSGSYLGLWRL